MNDVLKPGAIVIHTTHNIKTTDRIYFVVYLAKIDGEKIVGLQYIPDGGGLPPESFDKMIVALNEGSEWRFAEPSIALKALVEHESALVLRRQTLNQEIDNVGNAIRELTN